MKKIYLKKSLMIIFIFTLFVFIFSSTYSLATKTNYEIRFENDNDFNGNTTYTQNEDNIINNFRSENFSETYSENVSKNFQYSKNGLRNFNIKIYFIDFIEYSDQLNLSVKSYIIEWGNGEITKGEGENLPESVSHKYTKEGKYPIKIILEFNDGTILMYTQNATFRLTTEEYVKFWTHENKEAIATTTIGLGILGFALTETGKYKIISLLFFTIPMYTRIKKEDTLDNFVRGQIYGYIKTNPGITYNQILKNLKIKNGTLSYHLKMLEKMEMVKSRREGIRYRAFYPMDVSFPKEERYRLTDLQVKIIKSIKNNSGINQKQLAKKLNKNYQTINYNIKTLERAGLIKLKKEGKNTFLFSDYNMSIEPKSI